MPLLRLFLEHVATPIGTMLIATDEQAQLRILDWLDYEARMQTLLRQQYKGTEVQLIPSTQPSAATLAMQAYFEGQLSAIEHIPTATGGTDFQRQVWAALRTIPLGHTISYAELAKRIGNPNAVRAVGLANGANPISIVVPCHRVIGSNQSLTGYGGGLDRKQWLLRHEGALPQQAALLPR